MVKTALHSAHTHTRNDNNLAIYAAKYTRFFHADTSFRRACIIFLIHSESFVLLLSRDTIFLLLLNIERIWMVYIKFIFIFF